MHVLDSMAGFLVKPEEEEEETSCESFVSDTVTDFGFSLRRFPSQPFITSHLEVQGWWIWKAAIVVVYTRFAGLQTQV